MAEVYKPTLEEMRREALRLRHVREQHLPTKTAEKTTKAARRNAKAARKKALAKIHKTYGPSALMRLGDAKVEAVACVPTGFPELDDAISGDSTSKGDVIPGTGRGLPRGRVIEVFGPESAGKTTLTLELIRSFQAAGFGRVAFVDAEHALDVSYAKKIGVDVTSLDISQPNSGEEALNIVQLMLPAMDLIVIDSVAALTPQKEIDGDVGASHVGLHARLMGQALRKITAQLGTQTMCTVIFVNQIRMKIGVMFGSPETTPGGRALRFYSSCRIDIRRVQTLKTGEKVRGIRSRIKLVKNKIAPPFREMYCDIKYGRGIVETFPTWGKGAGKGKKGK